MQLFTELLAKAVASKAQIHITFRHCYFNAILVSKDQKYHAHFSGENQNAGLHFDLKDVHQILVQQGTDGQPCFSIEIQ